MSESLPDQVVEHITQNILAGRFVPGQRLVEADLTQTLRISRGPVREAFRRLDALGELNRTMHRGACVRALNRQEAEDLLTPMEPLIGLAARLAAERFAKPTDDFDADRFGQELQPFLQLEEDTNNLLNQRQHFYDVLVDISGNTAFNSLIPTLRIHLLRMQFQSLLDQENRRQHLEDYATIANAVVKGKARAARKFIVTHLRRMRAVILSLPDAAFVQALPARTPNNRGTLSWTPWTR